MPSLPTGTVTLLFTDVEGSTRVLEQLKDAYADVLAECRRLVRNRRDFDYYLAVTKSRLGERAFNGAWAEGQARTLEQAIEYGLAVEAR